MDEPPGHTEGGPRMPRPVDPRVAAGVVNAAARYDRVALLILVSLLLIRLGLSIPIYFQPTLAVEADAYGYLSLATSLVTGQGYTGGPGTSHDLFRPPAYPAFLALIFGAVGLQTWVAVAAQQALLGIIPLLFYGLGKRLGERRMALASAIIFSLAPNAALWGMLLMSETLFSFLLVLAAACFGWSLLRGSRRATLASGVLLGLSALVRPIAQALFLAWEGLVLVAAFRARKVRAGLGRGLLLAIGFLALIVPWAVRNWSEYGLFALSPVDRWYLSYFVASSTLADAEGISLEQARERVLGSGAEGTGEILTPTGVILRHPVSFLKGHLRGTLATLFGYGRENLQHLLGPPPELPSWRDPAGAEGMEGALRWIAESLREADQRRGLIVAVVLLFYSILVYALAGIGLSRLWRAGAERRVIALALVVTLAALLLPVGVVGNARFRVPMEPFLAILAGAGVVRPYASARPGPATASPTVANSAHKQT